MPKDSASGKVFLVGAGPGDPGLLTLRAANALANAEVLLYDALAADAVVALAPPACERIFVGKRGGDHAMPQAEIEALAIARAREGKNVVRLKGGDPFVFGRGGEEGQALREAGVAFEIVPGISSAIAAPAYAGIPVTHRGYASAFTVVTGHEDPLKETSALDWQKLADPHRTLVFLMAVENLAAIVERLTAHGLSEFTPAAIVQDGTRPTQRTVAGRLGTIADDADRAGITAPAVLVVGDVVRMREHLRWFDIGPLFGKRVLITRPAHHATEFAQALQARGAEPIVAPTIAIEPPDDAIAAHRAIDQLGSFAWIVFTSRNGVDAFFDRLHSLDADARYLGPIKIAAIGSATARALRRNGVRPDVLPGEYIGEEIARAVIESARPNDRVLVFRAQEARDVLPQMLTDAGLETTVVAAYKTVVAGDREFASKVARAGVVTFTSPSTVHGFATLLGGDVHAIEAARDKVVACIGPITADAARKTGLHVDIVADEFTAGGLLDALESHFA
jgi:uroporphyrinogen III methyltransferase/synthase